MIYDILTDEQQQAIHMVDSFLKDPNAFDMFLSGQAGSGKTTLLGAVVELLLKKEYPHVVCAYTHKAKNVLIGKLPQDADVRTLHSFLRKRPGINENARNIKALQVTSQFGKPQEIKLLIVDEYSMVGESDVLSIGELQDPDYTGIPKMKVLYVGDPLQLAPVGQAQVLDPSTAKYSFTLKEVQRQGAGPLLDTICEIVDMMQTGNIHKLEPNDQFIRGIDIAQHIADHKPGDFAVLAYTNKRVEELNWEIADTLPETNARWSPSLRAELDLTMDMDREDITHIITHSGPLVLGTKYKTLEHLLTMPDISFSLFDNKTEGKVQAIAYVFGHYQYKLRLEQLAQAAADSNAAIPDAIPKSYCKKKPHCKKCRKRAKAWRDYLTFKECVMCVDYPYAMTIHKSQGSTFRWVYIDNTDLKQLLNNNKIETYLKLLYVGISRASDKVFMNS